MQSRLESLEKDCCQLIDERDERDEVIDALMAQVLGGDRKEWSSAYGFNDAVVDVECRIKDMEKDAALLDWLGKSPTGTIRMDFNPFAPTYINYSASGGDIRPALTKAMQSEKWGV